MKDLFGNNSDAIFSDCRRYRYALWRVWDESKPKVMFIGLNPSTANETSNDNTITKVVKIAKNNGYGGVYMTNLFAWVTAYPEELKKCNNPLGENNYWLITISGMCKDVVFAWGNFKEAQERSKEVIENFSMFIQPKCITQNKNGSPKHPLYCKDESILKLFLLNGDRNDKKDCDATGDAMKN
jgi:hypothetical protein